MGDEMPVTHTHARTHTHTHTCGVASPPLTDSSEESAESTLPDWWQGSSRNSRISTGNGPWWRRMQQNQKQKLVIASYGIYLRANKRRQKGLAPAQRSLARCMTWSSAKAAWLSASSSLPASGREGVVCQHACVNVQWREVCGAISFVGAMHKNTNPAAIVYTQI